MIPWFLAVVTASLFGSLHCVGMCGPFVLLATKPLDRTGLDSHSSAIDTQRLTRLVHLLSYHLGRLTTYWYLVFWLARLLRPLMVLQVVGG
jgi:sulfite exporter TauE/SafE